MGRRSASLLAVSRFQAELERLFRDAIELAGGGLDTGEWRPAVDVVDSPETITILMEVPGLRAADLEVEIEGGMVTVSGHEAPTQPPSTDVHFQCVERGHGRFVRQVQLFWPINSHRGVARLADGLLTIEFPKVQEKREQVHVLEIESLEI
jgi:HSP20 family protein